MGLRTHPVESFITGGLQVTTSLPGRLRDPPLLETAGPQLPQKRPAHPPTSESSLEELSSLTIKTVWTRLLAAVRPHTSQRGALRSLHTSKDLNEELPEK